MFWGKLFGKKEKHEIVADDTTGNNYTQPKVLKNVSLSEARALLSQRLTINEASVLRDCAQLRDALVRTISELKAVVNELARADVVEPRARASKTIKDGFAQRALNALERINVPIFNNISDVYARLGEIERMLAAVSIGPREAMHVKFFFEEQMTAIATKLHIAFDLIAELKKRFASSMEKRKEFENLFNSIEHNINDIADKKRRIEGAEHDVCRAKEEIAVITMNDLTELERLRNEIAQYEKMISDLNQNIASNMSPAIRLLKRYGHTADKRTSELVRSIEAQPAAVFCANADIVKGALASAILAVRNGEIITDAKEVIRAEDVLARFDTLIAIQERRSDAEHKLDELKFFIERENEKERANAAAESRIASLENTIAEIDVHIVSMKREIVGSESRINELRKAILRFSVELGETINIG